MTILPLPTCHLRPDQSSSGHGVFELSYTLWVLQEDPLTSGESLIHQSFGLLPLYDMKLLAVDIAIASDPEQELFLIGDEKRVAKSVVGLIPELIEAMAATKEFDNLVNVSSHLQ
ncbi:hypothetical protein F2Q70_00017925 [Brassica cretica]|uniref:Uncharacterized protein n=1 Tax=Brassica cretica TaxID=69181 RepID=A0A8S9I1M9_BRACR|nr:hypothetical protein F2Q70_00017925 [Brassica cretica]